MNLVSRIFCRAYQGVFRLLIPVLPYREPELYSKVQQLESLFEKRKPGAALLVTDAGLYQAGLTVDVEQLLRKMGIPCVLYTKVQANPTVANVEEARQLYVDNGCECIIALGGGSPMDCAKGVGARIAHPRKPLSRLKGLLKVWRKLPPLIAIPTTAGTGSEVTLTAVITDDVKKHKYTINSFPLIPRYAVLDPALTRTLPPGLTAATGMDALTHAVEAYIGRSTTKKIRQKAQEAVRLIFSSLKKAYEDGGDMEARENMLRAAYAAGVAFSISYVGYVHAVAHSLGGQYNMPHGLTNAVLLPEVLTAYGKKIYPRLSELALAAGVASPEDSVQDGAQKFIAAIRDLNAHMGIPDALPGIRRKDVPLMAAHAAKEANPLYPVPVLMNAQELEGFYYRMMNQSGQ